MNSEDFTLFSHNLGQSGMMWDDGDFNYDGTVNSEDFTPLSDNSGPVRPDRRSPLGTGVAGCGGNFRERRGCGIIARSNGEGCAETHAT